MGIEKVILVDINDREIGTEEKLLAHQKGLLHRAFSAFVVRPDGRMLLQRRAMVKYHSPGLWSNACCSHPRPGETVLDGANRRMMEEMGITVNLKREFAFTYRVPLSGELVEYEYDHVLIGQSESVPSPAQDEVAEWRWVSSERIQQELLQTPEAFTAWFRIVLSRVLDHCNRKYTSV